MTSRKQQSTKFATIVQPDESKSVPESIITCPLVKDGPKVAEVMSSQAKQQPVKGIPKPVAKGAETKKMGSLESSGSKAKGSSIAKEDPVKNDIKVEKEAVVPEASRQDFKREDSNLDPSSYQLPGLIDAEAKPLPSPKSNTIPILPKLDYIPAKVAVPRQRPSLPSPVLEGRPLVLATHLVPSLPVGLFELLAEAMEVATKRPVVVVYESRTDRPVAKDIADVAILPRSGEWKDGDLLPVTFVFAHRFNKKESPDVYADVVVAADRAPHVEKILDLRGHRCALPDRRQQRGAAALLLGHLRSKGESPAFFGNTLDSGSQLAALQMVAGKQAEVGILEAPVIACHKNSLPGVSSLHILDSLGPLPPYPIFVSKSLPADLVGKISSYLLNLKNDEDWIERLSPFGILGFTENSPENYIISDAKPVATSVPYY